MVQKKKIKKTEIQLNSEISRTRKEIPVTIEMAATVEKGAASTTVVATVDVEKSATSPSKANGKGKRG